MSSVELSRNGDLVPKEGVFEKVWDMFGNSNMWWVVLTRPNASYQSRLYSRLASPPRGRGSIHEDRVRPDSAVLLPSPFNEYARFTKRVADLAVEHFVPQLSVEVLHGPDLPRRARLDVQRLDAHLRRGGSRTRSREPSLGL